ncbi:hypothetical protein TNCV_4644481 [Trichonephila clavipes]|nr:hypothetical protein TNCV_4644481 [Trichonephila clavipes]
MLKSVVTKQKNRWHHEETQKQTPHETTPENNQTPHETTPENSPTPNFLNFATYIKELQNLTSKFRGNFPGTGRHGKNN